MSASERHDGIENGLVSGQLTYFCGLVCRTLIFHGNNNSCSVNTAQLKLSVYRVTEG